MLTGPEDGIRLLHSLGASDHLIRHHELVVEAARALTQSLSGASFDVDARIVLVGASLHDAGKILFPAEMSAPGKKHERAGEGLLLEHGVEPPIARMCRVHGDWNREDATLEELLVTLADKLWKGKRVHSLEEHIVNVAAERAELSYWEVDAIVSSVFEAIAAEGDARLTRSLERGFGLP